MASEALQRFAQELKAQREEKGVTLTQISHRTKIDIKFLQAIEEAKFDILPELYIRAFIKEYCQTADINPKLSLDKYDSIRSGKEEVVAKLIPTKEFPTPEITSLAEASVPQEVNKEFESTIPIVDPPKETKSPPNIKLNYILGGLVLLVAIVIFYFAFIQESSSQIITNEQSTETTNTNRLRYEVADTAQIGQQPIPVNSPDQNMISETSVKNSQLSQSAAKSDSLQLAVQTNARVWIKVYTDGKVVFQQIVEKGTNLKYRAKTKFAVSTGDAGAVKLFYNNKQVPNIGKAGESRNIYMAPDGIRYYTISGNGKKFTPTR